jgi:hypothetical protein
MYMYIEDTILCCTHSGKPQIIKDSELKNIFNTEPFVFVILGYYGLEGKS